MDGEIKLKKDNQATVSFKVNKEFLMICKNNFEKANCKNRTEYIEKALAFYNQYLDSGESVDYLVPVLSSVIKTSVKNCEERFSRNLFKIAVELAKLSNMLAAISDAEESQINNLQKKCVEQVKCINGILDFEDVFKYQKS